MISKVSSNSTTSAVHTPSSDVSSDTSDTVVADVRVHDNRDNEMPDIPSYSDVTSGRRSASVGEVLECLVLGTSIPKGVGQELRSRGVNAKSYTYPSANIPYIRSRLEYIFKDNIKPKVIVLQMAGNDCTDYDVGLVKYEYGLLLNDLKDYCPTAEILLSCIPP